MRYLPLAIYAAITVVMLAIVISDFIFGRGGDVRRFVARMALTLIWPLAALSRAGREILFATGRQL